MNLNYFKRLFLISILNIITCLVFSQQNYLPGYIIKIDGDTLKGQIHYKNWDSNPTSIFFKEKNSDSIIKYLPFEINSFYTKNKKFVGAVVIAENSPTTIDNLSNKADLIFSTDTIFLVVLFEGKKSLYYYANSDGKENYYIKSENTFDWLEYKKYTQVQEGQNIVVENNRFIGQLILYLGDCDRISYFIGDVKYKKKNLYRLFEKYYNDTENNLKYKQSLEKIPWETSINYGISNTKLTLDFNNLDISYSDKRFTQLINAQFSQSQEITGGVSFDYRIPRNFNRLTIKNELLIYSYLSEAKSRDDIRENYYIEYEMNIGFMYLKFSNMLQYKYMFKNNFGLLAYSGISNGFIGGFNTQMDVYTHFYEELRTSQEETIKNYSKHEFGLLVGAGISYNRFSLSARYERGFGFSSYSFTDKYFLLLSYSFQHYKLR